MDGCLFSYELWTPIKQPPHPGSTSGQILEMLPAHFSLHHLKMQLFFFIQERWTRQAMNVPYLEGPSFSMPSTPMVPSDLDTNVLGEQDRECHYPPLAKEVTGLVDALLELLSQLLQSGCGFPCIGCSCRERKELGCLVDLAPRECQHTAGTAVIFSWRAWVTPSLPDHGLRRSLWVFGESFLLPLSFSFSSGDC